MCMWAALLLRLVLKTAFPTAAGDITRSLYTTLYINKPWGNHESVFWWQRCLGCLAYQDDRRVIVSEEANGLWQCSWWQERKDAFWKGSQEVDLAAGKHRGKKIIWVQIRTFLDYQIPQPLINRRKTHCPHCTGTRCPSCTDPEGLFDYTERHAAGCQGCSRLRVYCPFCLPESH